MLKRLKSDPSRGMHAVILGGGPAGSACALRLLRSNQGPPLRVTIVEGKDFKGGAHYNQCVGVLSPPLEELLVGELGIGFPHHLVQRQISGYTIHTHGTTTELLDDHPSVALRRVQFDSYMLEQACARGAQLVSARGVDLEFHDDEVVLYTESFPIIADVIIGAFGLDEGCAGIFSRVTDYRPPRALNSIVTKYHPSPAGLASFGAQIHAFLPRSPRIEFAGITPKGNHLTINIAGEDVNSDLMGAFIADRRVAPFLPDLYNADNLHRDDLRFFKGRFPNSQARHSYGDRFVIIGDASGLVRAFKGKGVTSAVLTGIRAANSILCSGFTRRAFAEDFEQANFDLISDLPYGRLMRLITIRLARNGMLDAVIRASQAAPGLRRALLGAVSGTLPYRQVLHDSLRPAHLSAILRSINHHA